MTYYMGKVVKFGKRMARMQARPASEPEVLKAPPLPMLGLYALLTEEQKLSALNFEEPESFGGEVAKS
ncbi:MAG: hypothetical protein ACU0CC_04835 [Sagittula sp.]|uniref:hypothetical protein n=1 Tax=Sagittula sp. TaxID=2038081 RepID=UPI004057CCC0